jgi:Flp pilus assembly protein TadB
MTSLVGVIAVLAGLTIGVMLFEWGPVLPQGKAARILTEAATARTERPGGLRGLATLLDAPVSRWNPARLLRKMSADLYWAQLAGKWRDWTPAQLLSLRLIVGGAAGILGLIAFEDFLLGGLAAFLGWQAPAMLVASVGRCERRRFQAQFPEFIQLLAAQAAVGISLDEALARISKSESAVAKWMGRVLRSAQGRSLFPMLAREARSSQLPELVSFAIQLEFVARGLSQQDLLQKLARSVAGDYLNQADTRAEKVGSELVIPMVIFYFLPFVVTTMAIIGWPILMSMAVR